MSRKGWTLFIALCVIWGMPYLLIRIAVRDVPPPALLLLRTAPAALLLAPFVLRRARLRPLLEHWRWVVGYTLLELCIPWLALSHAEERISSSLAGLLVASVPLVGAVMYRLAKLGDPFDARRLVGLCVGFAGVVVLVGVDVSANDPLAVAEMGVVALCYAAGPLVISRHLSTLPSLSVITVSLILCAAIYTPAGIATMPSTISGSAIAAIATLSLVCTVCAFLIFFALIREVGPARSTVITYVNPLVAVLLGVVFLSEPFTLGIALGMPLILLGSVLGTAPNRLSPPIPTSTRPG